MKLKPGYLTNDAIVLAEKAVNGTVRLTPTRAVLSSDDYSNSSDDTIMALKSLNAFAEIKIDYGSTVDPSKINFPMKFDNTKMTQDNYVKTVGIYFSDGTNEYLYSVLVNTDPELFPAYNGSVAQTLKFNWGVFVGRASQVNLTLSDMDNVTTEQLTQAVTSANSNAQSLADSAYSHASLDLSSYASNNDLKSSVLANTRNIASNATDIAAKANTTDLSNAVTTINTELGTKADKTYVDSQTALQFDNAVKVINDKLGNFLSLFGNNIPVPVSASGTQYGLGQWNSVTAFYTPATNVITFHGFANPYYTTDYITLDVSNISAYLNSPIDIVSSYFNSMTQLKSQPQHVYDNTITIPFGTKGVASFEGVTIQLGKVSTPAIYTETLNVINLDSSNTAFNNVSAEWIPSQSLIKMHGSISATSSISANTNMAVFDISALNMNKITSSNTNELPISISVGAALKTVIVSSSSTIANGTTTLEGVTIGLGDDATLQPNVLDILGSDYQILPNDADLMAMKVGKYYIQNIDTVIATNGNTAPASGTYQPGQPAIIFAGLSDAIKDSPSLYYSDERIILIQSKMYSYNKAPDFGGSKDHTITWYPNQSDNCWINGHNVSNDISATQQFLASISQ